MSAENPHKSGWLRIGLPNETPEEHVDGYIFDVADYKLEEVVYVSGDYTRIGTVVEANIMAKGFRDLKSSEDLSEIELTERDRVEDMYHDFEFDTE